MLTAFSSIYFNFNILTKEFKIFVIVFLLISGIACTILTESYDCFFIINGIQHCVFLLSIHLIVYGMYKSNISLWFKTVSMIANLQFSSKELNRAFKSFPNQLNWNSKCQIIYTNENELLKILLEFEKINKNLLDSKSMIRQIKISNDLDTVIREFKEHESLVLNLAKYQSSVLSLLKKANNLINTGFIKQIDQTELTIKVDYLKDLWEELNSLAINKQMYFEENINKLQILLFDEIDGVLSNFERRFQVIAKLNLNQRKKQIVNFKIDLKREIQYYEKNHLIAVCPNEDDQSLFIQYTKCTNKIDTS